MVVKRRLIRTATLVAVMIATGGCALGPDYERPVIDDPQAYRQPIKTGESIADLSWWQQYQDPQLRALIELALAENNDLAIAVARIEEARARYGFVRADQFPRIEGTASAGRGNQVGAFIPGVGVQEQYVLAGGVSWEVDLFGKLRRSSEAARAELLATEEARRAVTITLIAEVASAYLLLRDLDTRYEISQRTLKTRKDSTALVTARFDKGTVALIDVNQAQIEEADAAVQMASLERAVIQTENLINVLVGRNPGPILRQRNAKIRLSPPDIPAGLPSELLERRPDVRQAEQQLAAQTARIGVAEALRWPSLNLTTSLGLASTDLSDLLDSDQKIWDISGNLFAPIFNSGQNKRRVEVEKARTEQLLNAYEQTVLQAFREVEDALVGIRTLHDEARAREGQVKAARSAATLSRARYDGGVTSYLEVLESERSLFRAELAESSVRREQLVGVVSLYKALGGGWTQDAVSATSEQPPGGTQTGP
jgi:multidrug efflux system outer membrane protein